MNPKGGRSRPARASVGGLAERLAAADLRTDCLSDCAGHEPPWCRPLVDDQSRDIHARDEWIIGRRASGVVAEADDELDDRALRHDT